MRFHYNVEKIQELLSAVSSLTGISMAFLDDQGHFLCQSTMENDYCSQIQKIAKNRDKCNCSDRELIDRSLESGKYECHICYAGLYDAAIPLVKNGIRAGNVIMGRVRTTYSSQNLLLNRDGLLGDFYEKIPLFTDEQLESLRILLPNILFESAICIERDTIITEIADYIEKNFQQPITIQDLCMQFHISKNVLYQQFHKELDCTVNDYIIRCRMEQAKEMLITSDYAIAVIAEVCGFGSNTYFNRVFKKRMGITPVSYRRNSKDK